MPLVSHQQWSCSRGESLSAMPLPDCWAHVTLLALSPQLGHHRSRRQRRASGAALWTRHWNFVSKIGRREMT